MDMNGFFNNNLHDLFLIHTLRFSLKVNALRKLKMLFFPFSNVFFVEKGKPKVIRGHYYSRRISAPGPDFVGREEFHQVRLRRIHKGDTRPTMKFSKVKLENQN
jgi:hypothetical protein